MRRLPHHTTVRELDPPGDMTGSKVYPFEFSRVDLLYESYNGINVRLRYLLRVTVTRMYASTCTRDFPLWVRNTHTVPTINNSIKMEVRLPPRPVVSHLSVVCASLLSSKQVVADRSCPGPTNHVSIQAQHERPAH